MGLNRTLSMNGIFDGGKTLKSTDPKSVPKNLDEMRKKLTLPGKAELSEERFMRFMRIQLTVELESDLLKEFLALATNSEDDQGSEYRFVNFIDIVKPDFPTQKIVKAKPDYMNAAEAVTAHSPIIEDLSELIIPNTKRAPMAPNFFLEAKGPDGNSGEAIRQALYDGALGERGQVMLRLWRRPDAVPDNKAHTITCTYCHGMLSIYSIHAVEDKRYISGFQYFMYPLDAYAMLGNINSCRAGMLAFKNMRDFAEESRNESLKMALDMRTEDEISSV